MKSCTGLVVGAFLSVALADFALALSCRPPPDRWEAHSGNREYTLVVTRTEGSVATKLRLVRVDEPGEVGWSAETQQRHLWEGIVSDDGTYVATIAGCGETEVTLRNFKGEVVRTVAERELASIWERLHGGSLRFRKFDLAQGILSMDVAFDSPQVDLAMRTRRIRLNDGAVLDPPTEPAELGLPVLKCDRPDELVRDLTPYGLIVVACGLDSSLSDGPVRLYSWAQNTLRLWASGQFRDGKEEGYWWSAEAGRTDPKGPCETIYRNGDVVSQRCGPDVASPPQ